MRNKVSIYLLFKKERLSVTLFNSLDKQILSESEIAFLEIVPKLIELIVLKLAEKRLDFNFIQDIFLAQRESRWNSNRLVVAFVQALSFGLTINIYKKDLGTEEKGELEGDWVSYLNSFEEISWKELEPLYNKCPIINT
ncbi:retrotransposon peptidase family protein [Mycoplasma wenyonii str. Massachusetts]|uniref:Retrotransposon peptidase family protein n=1 Tax=Mycoplasma wenyonii (strain Massachusetts) TaxID=1197325 RepID=I6Z6W3_MYCWM|nr:hypothetical protein [Mycoplasma wenyonii]AFN65328.1 retrotransposon peptidase family protein [Mycoplasma wenyonii str. Massachusetts]